MSYEFKKYVLHEFPGNGRIILQDGREYTTTFQIYLLNSGNLVGSLWFTKVDDKLNDVVNLDETFRLDGEGERGLKILAEQCAFYSYSLRDNDNFPVPLLTAGFIISVLKVYNAQSLENLEKEGTTLCIEVGISNYYSTNNFLVHTEIGEIRSFSYLSQEDIAIFKKMFIPFNTICLQLKVRGEKSFEATKQEIFKVIEKVLDLTSFALTSEHRWSYYKIYQNQFLDSQFMYYESISRLPKLPNSHNNISESRIGDFLNKSYYRYTDQLNTKYNFSLALGWYLDSVSLRYDVMKYISASTALESILDAFSTESELILSKKDFDELRKKIEAIIENEIGEKIPPEDLELMLSHLPNINRRSYRIKAEALLGSLGILDDQTTGLLSNIITVRNEVTHKGKYGRNNLDIEKVAKTYLKLFSLLTRIFFRILVPDDTTFYQEFHNKTWKTLR